MKDAKRIASRVEVLRKRNIDRDANYMKLIAIRDGDYERLVPGLFDDSELDRPLVANLVDTAARDISEVMAPLPTANCAPSSLSKQAERDRSETRSGIANAYIQNSRLQDQMFSGTDRYVSFGFLAYIVEPDFKDKMPVIRVSDAITAHYTMDYRGRVKEYCEVFKAYPEQLCADFPDYEQAIKNHLYPNGTYPGHQIEDRMLEVARWMDDDHMCLVLLEMGLCLAECENFISRCPVRIVQRPNITDTVKGQFDDVLWVQVARAMVQMYTMNALDRAVNAPLVTPKDINEIELGPFSVLQSDNPQGAGYLSLNLPPGLFPEQQMLQQEQRVGSRYPEGRSGNIDASIITGQGVQALMGTFDTQVSTFHNLNSSGLEDTLQMCFEMDEKIWGKTQKSVRIKDNGAPREIKYTPAKDIAGNYTVDVSYGAIAGLDPNRALVFVLQALAGQLISLDTARRYLPVDLNVQAEERQINLEGVRGSLVASIAALPQALPMMVTQGMDPRELVTQVSDVMERLEKGEPIEKVAKEVFAPKQEEPAQADPLAAMQQQAQTPAGLPGQGGGGASDMLMSLAGMTPGGDPNLQSSISRQQPI